jgi:hypothetical protein
MVYVVATWAASAPMIPQNERRYCFEPGYHPAICRKSVVPSQLVLAVPPKRRVEQSPAVVTP